MSTPSWWHSSPGTDARIEAIVALVDKIAEIQQDLADSPLPFSERKALINKLAEVLELFKQSQPKGGI